MNHNVAMLGTVAAVCLHPHALIALDYNAYDHYSAANCIFDDDNWKFVDYLLRKQQVPDEGAEHEEAPSDGPHIMNCDIPTGGANEHISSRLTGVTMYLAASPVKVSVCAAQLEGGGLIECTPEKDGRASKAVLFDTPELAIIRSLQPWYNYVLYVRLVFRSRIHPDSAIMSVKGYRVFWKVP